MRCEAGRCGPVEQRGSRRRHLGATTKSGRSGTPSATETNRGASESPVAHAQTNYDVVTASTQVGSNEHVRVGWSVGSQGVRAAESKLESHRTRDTRCTHAGVGSTPLVADHSRTRVVPVRASLHSRPHCVGRRSVASDPTTSWRPRLNFASPSVWPRQAKKT